MKTHIELGPGPYDSKIRVGDLPLEKILMVTEVHARAGTLPTVTVETYPDGLAIETHLRHLKLDASRDEMVAVRDWLNREIERKGSE